MWRSLCGFNCDLTADIVECNRQCPSVGDCNTLQKCQNMSELRHVLVRFSAWSLDPYIIFISSIMTFSNAFIVVLLWISLLLHSRWAIDEATLWHKGEFWTSSNFTLEFIYSMSVSDKSEIYLDCYLWEKEPKGNKNDVMHCWRRILANMFRSMTVSWFIHVKIPYHIRICGLFGARSSIEITIK